MKAVIKANQSLSNSVELTGDVVVSIITPSVLAGTIFTFQASPTKDGTYKNVYDTDGNELQVTMSTDRYIVGALKLAGMLFLKIRTGTAAAPTLQSADRTIDIDTR